MQMIMIRTTDFYKQRKLAHKLSEPFHRKEKNAIEGFFVLDIFHQHGSTSQEHPFF